MLKTLVTVSAVVALLAAVPAMAQNGPQPAAPAASDQPLLKTAPQPVQPGAGATATPAPAAGNQVAAPADTNKQVAATDKFLTQQEDGQILASSVMGQTVYDASGNNLGSVNDIVFDKDHSIVAVVIGVGGFLGIGQKNVAVSMGAIDTTTDENGKPKLVLNASKDEIDQAPAFTTLADLKAQQQQRQMQTQPPAGGVLAPAPAPASPNTTTQ